MKKLHIITLGRLQRAVNKVISELERHGFWDEEIAAIEVYLVPADTAFGRQYQRGTGDIWIPVLSGSKILDWWKGRYTALADVVRHEYGHAFAYAHPGLMERASFEKAFWTTIDDDNEMEYLPDFHVTKYAADAAGEDFAETFMLYLKHDGRLPTRLNTKYIRAKWRFIENIAKACAAGKTR